MKSLQCDQPGYSRMEFPQTPTCVSAAHPGPGSDSQLFKVDPEALARTGLCQPLLTESTEAVLGGVTELLQGQQCHSSSCFALII